MLYHRFRVIGLVLLSSSLLAVSATAVPPASHTSPTTLTVNAPPVVDGDATYAFSIAIGEAKAVRGASRLRLAITIIKNAPGQLVTFKDIVLLVPAESTSVQVNADGNVFVLDACYYEVTTTEIPPRMVNTTFGQMFLGGRVGLQARLAN